MKAHFSKRRLKIQSTFVQGAPKINNIASEASYVYILSGQKLIKNTNFNLGEFLKTWSFGQTVLPDSSVLTGQRLVEK